MDKKVFAKCISTLITVNQVKIDETLNTTLYNLMKDDFTDQEFVDVCANIMKHESLYGKYPTPHMFYKQKPSPAQVEDSLMVDACAHLVQKIEKYVNQPIVSIKTQIQFEDTLSQIEKNTISAFGGLRNIWESFHRNDPTYNKSFMALKKDIEHFFKDNWKAEKVLGIAGSPRKEISS